MNTELALKDLADAKSILDKHQTKFFLIYGTALGAYRDGEFLKGDYDIDLGSFDPSHREEIKDDLIRLGFEVGVIHDTSTNTQKPSKMILAERNIRVDTFFFEEEEGEYVAWKHEFTDNPFLSMPLSFNKTEKVKLYGIEYEMPTPAKDYLNYLYGDYVNNIRQGRLYNEIHGLPPTKY